MRHIHNKWISMQQCLLEQISKGTGHLENIFTDANSVMHSRIFKAYAAGTEMKMVHKDNPKNSTHNTPIWQSQINV